MTNIDLKKTYRDHYRAKATPGIVDLPARLLSNRRLGSRRASHGKWRARENGPG